MRTVSLSEMLARPRTQANAHNFIKWALNRKVLEVPAVCSHCGTQGNPTKDGRRSLQAHHCLGYEHPLAIVWLCAGCHCLEEKSPAMRGKGNHTFKLSPEVVAEIEQRTNAGQPNVYIAKQMGISRSSIQRARRGEYFHG